MSSGQLQRGTLTTKLKITPATAKGDCEEIKRGKQPFKEPCKLVEARTMFPHCFHESLSSLHYLPGSCGTLPTIQASTNPTEALGYFHRFNGSSHEFGRKWAMEVSMEAKNDASTEGDRSLYKTVEGFRGSTPDNPWKLLVLS